MSGWLNSQTGLLHGVAVSWGFSLPGCGARHRAAAAAAAGWLRWQGWGSRQWSREQWAWEPPHESHTGSIAQLP